MSNIYTHGVRTTAHAKAWVQTGFTKAQADAEAARLNELGTLPGVEYVADEVNAKPITEAEAAELADWFTGRYLKGQHVRAMIEGRERVGVIALNSPAGEARVNVRYTEATTGQVKVIRLGREHVTPIN